VAIKVVGLDIGTTMMRAAEVAASGRGGDTVGTLVKYAEMPMPVGAVSDGEVHEARTTASMVKQLWSQGGFSTKDVVVGIGNARTVVREMEMAELPMNQLRQSLPFHVEEFLPMSTDEALLDYYPTSQLERDGGTALRGMLVAAAKHSVATTVLAIESAGLKPQGVDLKAFAMMRALVRGQWAQSTVALVDIGARTTTVVVAEAGQPRLIRMLASGGQDTTEAIASATQATHQDAERFKREIGLQASQDPSHKVASDAVGTTSKTLVEGIRNTFVYYTGNNPGAGIQHVILTGGGALMPGLGQYLASACRLPVSFGDATSSLKTSKKVASAVKGREALISVPVGLAMAEVEK